VYTAIYDEAQSPDHKDISYIIYRYDAQPGGGDKAWAESQAADLLQVDQPELAIPLMRLSTSHHLDGLRIISVAGLQKAAPGPYLRQACALHSYQRAAV
jgi:hypothetical protein